MVCIVANADALPHTEELIRALLSENENITSIVLNVNKKPGNEILGRRCVTLYGKAAITDTLCGLVFDISPLSFYQVNHDGAEVLYGTAQEFAALTGKEVLLDLYCGVGTIGLSMAKNAARLIGVEVVPAAVENARRNAERNGIRNAEFICADAGEAAEQLASAGIHPDVVVVDPPRGGCDGKVLDAMLQMAPERIVMVSCNSATAARDCAYLAEHGYAVSKLRAVDMFPRTGHVETVVLLSRETNPLTVEVRMEVETGEVKEHPTYKRIQEYVQEKYGFKVHTAYIAEVKRMVGLDMHKAPNAVEQRKHEYHPCPHEKVEAIKDALRHFGLIAE